MTERIARRLDLSKKVLLSAAGLLALAAPIVFGLVDATQIRADGLGKNPDAIAPVFESVSIKPGEPRGAVHMLRMMYTPDGFVAADVTFRTVIEEAYGVQDNQIVGAPDWLNSATYDIEAKVDKSELTKLSLDQRRVEAQAMLQALLADRIKLTLHRETKELPIYALVIAENGPKLQLAKSGGSYTDGIKDPEGRPMQTHRMLMQLDRGQIAGIGAQGVSPADFAQQLSRQLGRTVLDKTGLKGSYDFNLKWTPDESRPSKGIDGNPAPMPRPAGPSLFTAIQQQLGLKLESQKASMPVLVIDYIETPLEN
jgi:uncharacterized protein (TIGR03435 family)